MASNDCAIFKVFLKTDDITEVKKFVVDDTSVITSFIFMQQKLQTVFPKLRENAFRTTWRDAEGDDVTIDSDDDLILAFTEMDGLVKTLYVTVLPYGHPQYQETSPHSTRSATGVVCDVCNKAILTYRYKCLQCYDFDLCGSCEHAGNHSHHIMMRSSTPELPFARYGRKMFECVNKAAKKANHMAYRECKKKSKCEKNATDAGCSGAEDASSKNRSGGCPMGDYIPQFYPLLDVISNAANTAMNAAATAGASAAAAASASGAAPPTQPTEQQKQADNSNEENSQASQFMETLRNVLSSVLIQPQQAQSTTSETNSQTQFTSAQSSQTTPSAPAPTVNSVDLTAEPMDTSQRETGWTILSHEGSPMQTIYPVLNPTVVTPPQQQPQQPQQPMFNQAFVPPTQEQPQQQQPPQQPQQPVFNQAHVPPTRQPHQPPFNSQIYRSSLEPELAAALGQLLEMGFSNEQALIELLRRYQGHVDEVVKHIFETK